MTIATGMEAVETIASYGEAAPFLFHYSVPFDRDELNPDTIRYLVSNALEVLEDAVEAAETAADWESIQLGFTFPGGIVDPANGFPRAMAVLNVSVKRAS